MTQGITSTGQGLFSPVGSVGATKGCAFWGRHWRPAPLDPRKELLVSPVGFGRCFKRLVAFWGRRRRPTPLHSCVEQPDRQNFAKSSLPACPVLLRCRSARKLFLPDLLRRMVSSWCAHIMAALLRKSIAACNRSCYCQGTMWFCKKSRSFKNASKTVFESSPYTLYKLKGVFLNRAFWKFKENSFFQRSPLPITI